MKRKKYENSVQMKMMMTMIKDEYFLETFCNISNKSKLRNK